MSGGRPTTFDQSTADKICALISEGKTLADVLRMEGMPKRSTVYDWIKAHPDFAESMNIARDLGADAIAEEALRIADTPLEGVELEKTGDLTKEKRGDMLGHRKLQVETRLKLLAKWHPKKYGEKMTAEHTGAGGSPLSIQIVRFGASDADDPTS